MYFKNYLKGIKRDILIINKDIENISKEFLNEDWLNAILEIQFVKNFMSRIYNDIKMSEDILGFSKNYQGYTMDIVFDLHYDSLLHDEKKEAVLNYLIYKIDVIDFAEVKIMREKYLLELRDDKSENSNIDRYIEFAETYDDLNKILYIYKEQEYNNASRENFIRKIFACLSKQFSLFKANTKEFLNFSKQFVTCLVKKGLTDEEKVLCVDGGASVVKRAIIDNARVFTNILSILFDITTVENNWKPLSVQNVNEFYEMLKKIDKKSRFMGLEDETNKLSSIRKYFGNLETELKDEKYKSIEFDFIQIFSDIKIIFDICEFWENIEATIDGSTVEENLSLLKKYFMLESVYSFRDAVFADVANLVEALKVLKEFYLTKENNYKSNYSLLILRLSNRMVLQYEENSLWFKEREKEIANLLIEAAKIACRLDEEKDSYTKDVLDKIKIYTYKFNEHCGIEGTICKK